MKPSRVSILAALVPAWLLFVGWLWPLAVQAGTLSAEFPLYDWRSLFYAAALGLLGGSLSLIVSLATDKRVVLEVLAEGGRNAIVSPIAGTGAYTALKALAAVGLLTDLPLEPRFFLIVAAGYAGIAAIEWARALMRRGADAFGEWLTRGRT